MGTLYEIATELETLYDMSTDPECDPQALADTIEGVMGELEVKASSCVYVIKQLEMEQEKAEAVSKEFSNKAQVRANSLKRIKEAIMLTMDRLGLTELEAGDYTIKIQKNGGKEPLILDHPEEVPDNLTKVTIEPDKDKIREFLKDNSASWAHMEPRGRHLTIK